MSDEDKKNYKVGYGRPPRGTQFGAENGNPRNDKGRPPGRNVVEYDRLSEEALWQCMNDILQAPVSYTEKNQEHTVPIIMLIAKRMVNDAANGDKHARRDVLKYAEKASKGLDKIKADFHLALLDHKDRVFEGMKNPGSLECYEAHYYWFTAKRNLRDLDGASGWPYESGEPTTIQEWSTFSSQYEYLKKNPTEKLPWPPKYSDTRKEEGKI